MIWFYGGGFIVGGSMGPNFLNNYLYSGQAIADNGNVIVVSVGYRVGVLGFLSTGDSRLPGKGSSWDYYTYWIKVMSNQKQSGCFFLSRSLKCVL